LLTSSSAESTFKSCNPAEKNLRAWKTAGERATLPGQMEDNGQLTRLLEAWSRGDERAIDTLIPLVYSDLHRLAHRYLADERPGHTLQTTALVNEAYLRLVDRAHANPQNRAQFFAVCSRVMRQILVDWARARKALKRGGAIPALELQEELAAPEGRGADLIAIDDALTALAAFDRRKSQVVEMRFFGGLSAQEIAMVLQVSEETVHRDWKLAKSWLRREMRKEPRKEGSLGN
jgi:RNA polymerase sigma-70 factor, ECF subfamily